MVPAFHSKAVSHGKNVQPTNSRAGTVTGHLYRCIRSKPVGLPYGLYGLLF
jgi:hypothetical protein